MSNKKYAVISLSGGMDSSTLLLNLLAEGYNVTAVSFDYGQKHRVELERAQALVDYLNGVALIDDPEVTPPFNPINYEVIKLDGLTQLLNSALVEGGDEVPEGHYEEDNMKATVVPNRNKIFSSIIQAIALSIVNEKDTDVKIAMGIHAGDHAIYPDCRQEFRDADFEAFRQGNWDADRVSFYTPYLHTDKLGILRDGSLCIDELGLKFDEVYSRTNTSYKPINHNGVWYSDYKSASSVERIEAFIDLGRKDPVRYADESGEVSWYEVVAAVSVVLAQAEINKNN
jgi:7-cyano-7-deazaguanine synthase